MRQIGDKVSYVRNPFARNSYYCLTLAVLGLALGTASFFKPYGARQRHQERSG